MSLTHSTLDDVSRTSIQQIIPMSMFYMSSRTTGQRYNICPDVHCGMRCQQMWYPMTHGNVAEMVWCPTDITGCHGEIIQCIIIQRNGIPWCRTDMCGCPLYVTVMIRSGIPWWGADMYWYPTDITRCHKDIVQLIIRHMNDVIQMSWDKYKTYKWCHTDAMGQISDIWMMSYRCHGTNIRHMNDVRQEPWDKYKTYEWWHTDVMGQV